MFLLCSFGNLVEIGVVPTAYLKPGEIDIKLHDVKFATSDEKYGYRADLLELPGITAEATSSLNLKVSSGNKYSTAILPFDSYNVFCQLLNFVDMISIGIS